MAHFNIYHVKINDFHRLYEDLIRSIAGALTDLGHTCTVRLNSFSGGAINILLGSTIFASRYHRLPDQLAGRRYIVYQLEQLDDRHGLLSEWPEYWQLLQNAAAIWDYSPASTEYLRGRGLQNVYAVPPSFHRSLESFRPRQDPDIDVLFIGSPHERRQRLIATLQARGLNTVDIRAVFGEQRNRFISRSKLVLNVHAWDDLAVLETVRLSFLLANRVCVVSEESDHNPYGDGVVYGSYGDLAELCAVYARQDREVREAVAERGYLAIRRIDLVTILRDAIREMGAPALGSLVAREDDEIDPHHARARPDLLTLVPPSARRVLDIGCGAGHTGAGLKQRQACHVTGIEILAAPAMRAARRLDLAICGDAFAVLPSLGDQGYDCVLMLDVLATVAEPAALLRLAAAKLAPGGVLVLCVANVAHWSVIQGLLQGRWDYADDGVLDRAHLRFFTFQSLQALVQEAGLQVSAAATTRLNGGAPPGVVVEAARQSCPPGQDVDAQLHSYQFVLACRKV
ncbi:MAG: methyltransferase domain-containing protein [Rhodospirillales bacterium]|nr:methyltransferase domain-containing protein [Rhodospirillales bacterium]